MRASHTWTHDKGLSHEVVSLLRRILRGLEEYRPLRVRGHEEKQGESEVYPTERTTHMVRIEEGTGRAQGARESNTCAEEVGWVSGWE